MADEASTRPELPKVKADQRCRLGGLRAGLAGALEMFNKATRAAVLAPDDEARGEALVEAWVVLYAELHHDIDSATGRRLAAIEEELAALLAHLGTRSAPTIDARLAAIERQLAPTAESAQLGRDLGAMLEPHIRDDESIEDALRRLIDEREKYRAEVHRAARAGDVQAQAVACEILTVREPSPRPDTAQPEATTPSAPAPSDPRRCAKSAVAVEAGPGIDHLPAKPAPPADDPPYPSDEDLLA